MSYTVDESAASIYKNLSTTRDNFLRRAEECSALTIPMLIPRASAQRVGNIAEFDSPRQGIGARGVNHLSSRLLLTLLPPSSPFFKFKIDPFALDSLTAQAPELQSSVAATLSQMEDSVHMVVNTEAMRVPAAELFKHLIVSGNGLTYLNPKGGMKFFPLSQYVVVRDPEGDECIEIIVKECLDLHALSEDLQDLAKAAIEYDKSKSSTTYDGASTKPTEIEIYTRQHRISANKFMVWQEFCNGVQIPKTEGTFTRDGAPYNAHRFIMVPGEAYGRGLVEEYKGDLINVEGLSQAVTEGSLAAARVVGLVAPNAQTRPQDINDAENGEFILGRLEDISFLSLEGKVADLRVAAETAAAITKRLEGAFLLNSSVIRDAERVTAEEVRFAAQELETTLGGTYTILANEFQLPLAKSILRRLQKKRAIPQFPKGLEGKIQPVIVTGVDALGRNEELTRIQTAFGILGAIIGPQEVARITNSPALATYISSKAGITIKGLFKSPQQLAEEQQAQQQALAMQSAVKGAVGPAVNAISKATSEANAPQQV